MKKQNGFTLIELMVTLAVAAILLTVGVPNFRDFILDNRVTTQANHLAADINLARSSAIRYQRNVQVCVSTSYSSATPACTAGTNWANGWIVWIDKDRDTTIDAPNEILRVGAPLEGTTTLTSAASNGFTYDSRGFVNAGDVLTLCDDRSGETGRLITIRDAGRVNVSSFGGCS